MADALVPEARIGHRQTRRHLALLEAGSRRDAAEVGRARQAPASRDAKSRRGR